MLSEAVADHQDDEANMGFVLEEFLDKVVGVELPVTAHRLHVRAEFRVFAFKIGIGRLSHESIVHPQAVAVYGLSRQATSIVTINANATLQGLEGFNQGCKPVVS